MKVQGWYSRLTPDNTNQTKRSGKTREMDFADRLSSSMPEQKEDVKAVSRYWSSPAISIVSSKRISAPAAAECAVKNISYSECDHVKISVEQGYVLKAQADTAGQRVYVEVKQDDGTVKGYEMDPTAVDPETENPIEQMALETWELAGRSGQGNGVSENTDLEEYMGMTIETAMESFYDFIKDRIVTGGPSCQIGAESMTVKEWDRLIENIDEDLDEIIKEQEERIGKAEKEELEQRKRSENLPEELTEEQLKKILGEQ